MSEGRTFDWWVDGGGNFKAWYMLGDKADILTHVPAEWEVWYMQSGPESYYHGHMAQTLDGFMDAFLATQARSHLKVQKQSNVEVTVTFPPCIMVTRYKCHPGGNGAMVPESRDIEVNVRDWLERAESSPYRRIMRRTIECLEGREYEVGGEAEG